MSSKLIAVVDLETDGLNFKTNRVIEIGAVLWDWSKQKPVLIINDLVQSVTFVDPAASKINGITGKDLIEYGIYPKVAMKRLNDILFKADYLMGHNIKEFDLPFIKEEFQRAGEPLEAPCLNNVLDTRVDIKYNILDASRKLSHLAAAHGILNPYPHRAVFDALTTVSIAAKYNLEEIVARAGSPTVRLKAIVDYDNRDVVKRAGFHWDPNNSYWYTTIKACDSVEYPFKTVRIETPSSSQT